MAHRHEVTEDQWKIVEPFVSVEAAATGRPPRDRRELLNGVLWILRTGAPWRDIPERYGPWPTVYACFRTWASDGTLDRVLEALQIRLDREGKIDWNLFCIDGSSVRASRSAAGASKKNSAGAARNRKTTLWAAREADSAASSIWLLRAKASRSPSK